MVLVVMWPARRIFRHYQSKRLYRKLKLLETSVVKHYSDVHHEGQFLMRCSIELHHYPVFN